MKAKLLPAVLLFAAQAIWAQIQPPQFIAIRLSRAHQSSLRTNDWTRDCVSVRADGTFHREHQRPLVEQQPSGKTGSEPIQGGADKPSSNPGANQIATDVYEGKLAPGDLNALLAAINSEAFNQVLAQAPTMGPVAEGDSIWIHIVRVGSRRRLLLDENAQRQYKANLQPLLDWWAAFERQKLEISKTAQANGCRVL